jgi:glucose/arabinose dehydrogenase
VPFATGFGQLTFATNAGDGSGDLYVVVQVGRILKATQGQSVPGAPWLDITDRIIAGGEQGLLGLAFHPDFASNGRFFVDYTDRNGHDVVSEFVRGSNGSGDPASERVLLQVDDPFPNHNGGMLAFGPDGYLYIGLGDGGAGGDPLGSGQSLTTNLGKILRIDVDSGDPFGIPADNPFQPGNAQGALPQIWDWGMRNPWRFSFDRATGGLFIGDVGQNQTEEIDVEPAGQGGRNYGWNIMEGDHCYQAATCAQDGLTLPVATHSHGQGCSVTGGYVYRGTRFPELDGQYFYSDYCSGTIWAFDADAALAGQPVTPTVFGQVDFPVSSFGEDEAGELYLVNLNGQVFTLGSG